MTELQNTNNHIFWTKRLTQPISFQGLDLGPLMFPTDIDACIEWKNKAYIFFELKTNDKPLSTGQRIALERLTKDIGQHKYVITLVCEHKVDYTGKAVVLADTIVRAIYTNKELRWREPRQKNITAKEVTMQFLDYIERKERYRGA